LICRDGTTFAPGAMDKSRRSQPGWRLAPQWGEVMPRNPVAAIGVVAFAVYDPLLFSGIGALAIAVEYLWSQGIGLAFQFAAIMSIVYLLGQISGA
jgi:hypothetical protein